MSFHVEDIPGCDELYKAVPRKKIQDDDYPEPGVFVKNGTGVSTSWSKYSTALACRTLRSRPEAHGVYALPVQGVRDLAMGVSHTPKDWCQAHADIVEVDRDPEYHVKLARMAAASGMRLRPNPPKLSASEEKRAQKASYKKT
ncbi:MAG TPA: hypothetical protein VGM06_13510 [Polyangiaceae bacterium]|jgi:hypothetical protein